MKVDCDPEGWGVDMMSLSAHKLGGPKGIGALYIGGRMRNPRPLLPGGGQERGLRSGTEATAQIAGFAKAVELRQEHYEGELAHMAALKELLPGKAAGHGRRCAGGQRYRAPHSGGVAGGLSQRRTSSPSWARRGSASPPAPPAIRGRPAMWCPRWGWTRKRRRA